jgi:hypothetical protein
LLDPSGRPGSIIAYSFHSVRAVRSASSLVEARAGVDRLTDRGRCALNQQVAPDFMPDYVGVAESAPAAAPGCGGVLAAIDTAEIAARGTRPSAISARARGPGRGEGAAAARIRSIRRMTVCGRA